MLGPPLRRDSALLVTFGEVISGPDGSKSMVPERRIHLREICLTTVSGVVRRFECTRGQVLRLSKIHEGKEHKNRKPSPSFPNSDDEYRGTRPSVR